MYFFFVGQNNVYFYFIGKYFLKKKNFAANVDFDAENVDEIRFWLSNLF